MNRSSAPPALARKRFVWNQSMTETALTDANQLPVADWLTGFGKGSLATAAFSE